MRRIGSIAAAAAAAAVLAAIALDDAHARKFQMSGTWVIRRGQIFLPLQFAMTAMGTGMQMTHTSQGNLSMAFVPPAPGGFITAPKPVVRTVPCDLGNGGPRASLHRPQHGIPVHDRNRLRAADHGSRRRVLQRDGIGPGHRSRRGQHQLGRRWAHATRELRRERSHRRHVPRQGADDARAAPIPSLSPAGLATAAILLTLAAGYAARGRRSL